MNKIKRAVCVALALVAVMLVSQCGEKIAGNTSETGNPQIAGVFYLPDGHTPAAGVRVHIRPRNSLADTSGFGGLAKSLADTASVVTNHSGRFAFDTTIDTGTYVITSESGDNAVLVDSVIVKSKDSTVTLPPDTLKPAGALKGVIRLSEGGDPRKVFVLAFGIDRFARVNADGSFKFSALAEGKYDLRLISSLDNYGVLDTGSVSVRSADTTDLGTISLPFTGIPTPKNVRLSYDTLRQIVTLTWAKADTSLAKGYNVYRQHVDSGLVKLNAAVISDTVYWDSMPFQDNSYTYQVKAVDKSGNEGLLSVGVGVIIAGGFKPVAMYGNGQGSANGQFVALVGITVDDSGNVYCVDDGNSRIQKFDKGGNFLFTWGSLGSDTGKFNHPKGIAQDSLGNVYVTDRSNHRIQKFANNGAFISAWGTNGTQNGQFQEPYCIGVWKGMAYVGEWQGQRIQKFDLAGNFIRSIIVGNPVSALAISDSGIFAIGNDKRVFRYSVQGALLDTVYVAGKTSDGISDVQINSLYVLPSTGIIYMSNLSERKVQAIDFTGASILQFDLNQINEGAPQDISVMADGTVFVARYGGYYQKYSRQ